MPTPLCFRRCSFSASAMTAWCASRPMRRAACCPAFAEALAELQRAVIAIAQAGQLNTGAFDPLPELVRWRRQAGAWLHVDGAFGLWARASPTAPLADGIDGADSWATDGQSGCRRPMTAAMRSCATRGPSPRHDHRRQLPAAAAEGERDPSDFVPELSRRARGFATWAMIRHLGRSGIAAMVERHCRLARHADRLAGNPALTS